jgi:hypothetical protein
VVADTSTEGARTKRTAFDLLEWDGEDLRIKPYQRRFPIACWWFLIVVRRFRITDSSS